MRRRSKLSGKLNNVMFFLAGVLAVVIVGVLVIGIQTMAQEKRNSSTDYVSSEKSEEPPVLPADTFVENDNDESDMEAWEKSSDSEAASSDETALGGEKWAEGVISYKGHSYKYNTGLKIYLLMGVDKDGEVTVSEDSVSGGQSDAMFLLVADDENEKVEIISINRNTMTSIFVCDEEGKSLGNMEAQICVQHGFGDGKKLSCTRTVDAVSKLFYNLPISGYIAFNLGAIEPINSVVGGVEVEVLDDLQNKSGTISLTAGETVTLSDEEAYLYLRGRNLNKFDSATDRLRRQEQYINNYISSVKNSGGMSRSKVERIYKAMEPYMVSSVDFTELISDMIEYDYTAEDLYTVPGETVKNGDLEEFHVDQDEFYDLIFEVFYNQVD